MTDPFQSTSNPDYSKFIHISRYSRYLPEEERRETWDETVGRLYGFWFNKLEDYEDKATRFTEKDAAEISEVFDSVYNLEVMPSMRSLMTAGKALDRDNVAGYNCSYLAVDSPRSFDELMYILMCGTGVGFSVERQYIQQLPVIAEDFHETDSTVVFADSKIGWASGFRELVSLLYAGKIPKIDISKIRPSGARLKTFGGRASGPQPLVNLCDFTIALFKRAAGRRFSSIECHDLCCKIADIVVVGGVRRSALISLSNLSDDRMRGAKSGQWWQDNPQRALANNSAAYTEKPEFEVFFEEMKALHESKSGERGVFSRVASQKQAAKNGRRESDRDFGTNPCSEIILRPNQFCNLSEVVVRMGDELEDLKRKVRYAAILGTLQSTLTDFRYLRKVWKDNTEEECLLGVSLTGIMDHPVLNGTEVSDDMDADSRTISYARADQGKLQEWLDELREVAIKTNEEWADKLGVNPSTAITCVKPSGTVSQLVDSASGIHPRYSNYYIRTVRADVKDPLSQFMIDQGVYYEQDQMNASNYVFYFPMKSPDTAVTADKMGAMAQLNLWETYQDHWCEHKPSMTAYYTEDDFFNVCQWMRDKFDKVSGISFLPYSGHVYAQAPYIPVDEEEYNEWKKSFPAINWDEFPAYEGSDSENMVQHELACVAGQCEIV